LCAASMDDLYDYLELPFNHPETESPTVGGWIVEKLGRIPEEGDTFTFESLTVRVHKTEQRRALECIVSQEAVLAGVAGEHGS
ncbi:MAG: hypothetical protein FWC89_01480, partial [Defluviitaleaceae bacterium]|nr:hypothetical protein [Defluviitaleaceae bacterium]